MREILPGVLHWSAFNPSINTNVSSYYVESAAALIDPKLPEEGLDVLAGRTRPQQIILSTGLHTRDCAQIADAFGCVIRASRAGAERIGDQLALKTYEWDEEVAPGITAIEVGVLCPDEGSLHIAVGDGALTIADGLTRHEDGLGFFEDWLLGDDPQAVKKGLTQRYRALLEREFDSLLFAHAEPIVGGGKAALREFVMGR